MISYPAKVSETKMKESHFPPKYGNIGQKINMIQGIFTCFYSQTYWNLFKYLAALFRKFKEMFAHISIHQFDWSRAMYVIGTQFVCFWRSHMELLKMADIYIPHLNQAHHWKELNDTNSMVPTTQYCHNISLKKHNVGITFFIAVINWPYSLDSQ